MTDLALMGKTIPVVPQPWPVVAEVGPRIGAALTNAKGIAGLGSEAYDLICMLAPEVGVQIPRYAWSGFASEAEMTEATKPYGTGPAPTIPELVAAFKTALDVNGADTLQDMARGLLPGLSGLGKLLGSFLDQNARDTLTAVISGAVEEAARTLSSPSPSVNGASASTNGSTGLPPSAVTPEAGPSPASGPLSPAGTPSG